MNKKAIIVKRVSTTEQKRSSLSLINQEQVCWGFCEDNGFEIVAIYEDVVSGKVRPEDRPGLSEALKQAREENATIIISKLDRLSRSVEDVARMMNQGIPFVVVETPEATPFMLHIYSAIAEMERQTISARIKSALKVKKEELAKEGKKLGGPKIGKARKQASKVNKQRFMEFRAKTGPIAWMIKEELHHRGTRPTYKNIAGLMNEREIKTMSGKPWSPSGVMQLMKTYAKEEELEIRKEQRRRKAKKN